jgi:Na+/melibiose symporter-like transporter
VKAANKCLRVRPPAALLGAYIPPLYAQAGISLSLIGLIFMAARIFDVVTDPIMGALID